MAGANRGHANEDLPLAHEIGVQLRAQRHLAGLTQTALADGRYTKAYVSAIENGLVKPSLAALNFFAGRLGLTPAALISRRDATWTRLEADVHLASGDWLKAYDAYVELLETGTAANRAELLRGLAEAACRLERADEAVRAAAEAASIFDRTGRRLEAAWSRYWEAFGLYMLEQSDEARRLLRQLLDTLDAGDVVEPDLHVRSLIALGMVESRDDEPEKALGYLEAARALVDGLDERRRATFLFSLAISFRQLGDLEAAITSGTQSLALFRLAAADAEVASLENELALVHLAMGNLQTARMEAERARGAFEGLANERWLAHVVDTQAQIELASGNAGLAVSLGDEAVSFARATGNRKAEIDALVSLGRAQRSLGDRAAAVQCLEDAVLVARSHARRAQLQSVLGEFATLLAEQGDFRRAFEMSQEALHVGRLPPTGIAAPSSESPSATGLASTAQAST